MAEMISHFACTACIMSVDDLVLRAFREATWGKTKSLNSRAARRGADRGASEDLDVLQPAVCSCGLCDDLSPACGVLA